MVFAMLLSSHCRASFYRRARAMKIAVIGCGKQGARHLVAFRGLADLVAADLDPARADAAAARVGADRIESVDAVFAARDIAAVVIAAPTPCHAALAHRAVASGKHVLCEKPFGADASAARRIAAAAARRGLVGRVGYLYRFAPAIRAARHAMGRIGPIESAHFAIAAPGNHAAWKHRRDTGGGVVNELVSHMADLALWFFGPMRTAAAVERQVVLTRRVIDGVAGAADADDRIDARFVGNAGIAIAIAGDFAAPRFSQWLEIRGAAGLVRASIDPAFDSIRRLGTVQSPLAPDAAADLYRLQAGSFLDAIAGRAAPDGACGLAEAAAVCALLETLNAAPVLAPP
jgi:myo-inositol 2-dehydrogenase/D-chiro-inositol 1-dehydrogenase